MGNIQQPGTRFYVPNAGNNKKSEVGTTPDEVEANVKQGSEHDIKDMQKKVEDLQKIIQSLHYERDDLLLRLSKVIGDKLVQDNPNISDLSDKNRPTKLGEIYSELYDNEWTDAIEGLEEGGHSEADAISTLLLTLKKTFEFCEVKAFQLLDTTANAANVLFMEAKQARDEKKHRFTIATAPMKSSSEHGGEHCFSIEEFKLQSNWKPKEKSEQERRREAVTEIKMPLHFETEYRHLRKELAVAIVPAVQKAFLDIYWDDECIPAMKPFIKTCLFLCWMMVVQGPPMCFDWNTEHGSQFDANLYRQYKTSGTVVNFVVWPTMFLHEGGPVILKGVGEPMTAKSDDKP